MEKKKYHKPQINVIAIDAVGIMAVSTETIKKGIRIMFLQTW